MELEVFRWLASGGTLWNNFSVATKELFCFYKMVLIDLEIMLSLPTCCNEQQEADRKELPAGRWIFFFSITKINYSN